MDSRTPSAQQGRGTGGYCAGWEVLLEDLTAENMPAGSETRETQYSCAGSVRKGKKSEIKLQTLLTEHLHKSRLEQMTPLVLGKDGQHPEDSVSS